MRLSFDFADFERVAKRLDAFERQIPFALARSLNEAAEETRARLVDTTWAQHVKVRNPNFLKAALTTRGARATKTNLRVEIFDKLGRANLREHDRGGTKQGKGNLALPVGTNVRRGSHGISKGKRPAALPNSFKAPGKKGGGVIYQRIGTYQKGSKGQRGHDNRHLRLMYALHPTAHIKPDVPFEQDFARSMAREVPRAFSRNIERAMRTAFR